METIDFTQLAISHIQSLKPYQPGKAIEELERELGIENIIKLASNENPLGASPKVIEAVSVGACELHRYPDGSGYRLKEKLSDYLSVIDQNITLGNGSNEVIDLLIRAYCAEGDDLIVSEHAFIVYTLSGQSVGANVITVPAKNYGHDLEAMLAQITNRTKMICLANPNNPTGTWFDEAKLRRFLHQVPRHVIVLLDEAYAEYMIDEHYPDSLFMLGQFPNLVVARTFSKIYGLAGLRIGYTVSHPDIANILNRMRSPFNTNALALIAAEAALEDKPYVEKSREINTEGLVQLAAGFKALRVKYIPSVCNFISFEVKDAGQCYQQLLEQGVIVRPVGNYGLPNFLRVSVGLAEENRRFLESLAKLGDQNIQTAAQGSSLHVLS